MAEQNLKDKTVKGVGWSAIDNVAHYAVSFIVSVVLARILSPDDYGLLGIIAIFTAICQAIANGGFGTALIRKKDANEDDYDTAFVVNLGLSVFFYIVLFFVAPFISIFFEREELTLLTRVSSVGVIITALSIVPQTRLTKSIDFKTQTKITIIASTISGLIGVSMALLGFGVWSLVAQSLVSSLVRTLLLWFNNRWLPKFNFSKYSFNSLFGFGWKMMVVSVIDTTWKELYQVIVGKFYSPASLGQYTRAKSTSQLFSSNLTNIVQRVTYPVLSNIQDDIYRMISAYRRIIKTTMFITAICMFFLGAISESFLYCLIGPKWHEAATYLPLICIAGSLYPLHAINLNMLEVQGRSDLFLGLEIVKKTIALAPLLVGAFVGIMPMLYTNLLTGIISFFLNSYYSGKFLGYTSWMQVKDVAPSYGLALLIAIPVFILKFLPISNWIILPLQCILGGTVFLVATHLIHFVEWQEVKLLCTPFISFIRNKKK